MSERGRTTESLLLVSILLLLSFGVISTAAQAKTYSLTAKVNDWAEYSVSLSGQGSSMSATIKYVIVYKAVPGGNYSLGGNPIEVAYCDVYANGQKVLSANPSGFDSTTGLNTTGPFLPDGDEFWVDYKNYMATVSPTVSVSIGGSSASLDVTASSGSVSATLHLEVDKGTGVVTSMTLDGSSGPTSVRMTMRLTGTSLPVANSTVIVLAIGAIIAVVVVVSLLLIIRHRRRTAEAAVLTAEAPSPQPSETGEHFVV